MWNIIKYWWYTKLWNTHFVVNVKHRILLFVGGRGGGVFALGVVKIKFAVYFDEGESQLPDAFYLIKKYCSKTKLLNF